MNYKPIMTTEKTVIDQYFRALKLPKKATQNILRPCEGGPQLAALIRAHELRKFEIENYWKRATYFWSFQAVSFLVLGFMFDKGLPLKNFQLLQLPAALGALSAWVGYLSARGSKFWQENWEAHVDALEDKYEGRLTQTIVMKARSFSVSRLNEQFMLILTLGWLGMMGMASHGKVPECFYDCSPWVIFFGLLGVLAWLCLYTKSRLSGQQFDGNEWKHTGENTVLNVIKRMLKKKDSKTYVILRDPMFGKAEIPFE